MNVEYPFLKKYAGFILDNHLEALVVDFIRKAREENLPILKQLSHLTEEQLFEASKRGLAEDVLLPLTQGNPFYKIKETINSWKANSLIIPKEEISVFDLIGIFNIRKLSLIDMLKFYDFTKEEGIAIHKEIEKFFTVCITLGFEAAEEIQKGALKESQELLNGILCNIPVIVSRIDKEGNMLQSDGCGLAQLGLKDGELVGTNVFKNYPDAENTRRALHGEKVVFQGIAKSKTGEIRHYQSYFFPEDHGAIGFSIDITDQKVAEEKLREREYFIEQVADSTPMLIQVYDRLNNRSLYSNKELAELLGYTSEQINAMGKSISQIVHPEDLPKLMERSKRIEEAGDGEVIESEMRVRHANGEYRWLFSRSMVFKRTEEGKVWQTLSTSIDTTDKKNAEEKLQQQLRIFDTALSNTIDYNYIFDLEGKFIYINQPLLDFLGKTKEEAFGKNSEQLGYPSELANRINHQIQEIIKTKQIARGETELHNLEGKPGYYQYTLVPVFGNKDKVEAVVGTTQDITKLKEVAEKQYKSIFESTNDAILIYNELGSLVEVNPAGYKMHGYSYDEMIGLNGKDFIAEEDHQKFQEFISEVKEGKHYFANLRHLYKDGTFLFVEKTGAGFTYKGRPHLLAVVHDVTEKKKVEEALRESENRFRTMADNIPTLAWIADADGWIFWYNKGWYEYSGTRPEQMEGWGWQSIHDPKELPRVMEGWTGAIRNGESFEMVFPLKGADGIFRPFLTRVRPVKNSEGRIVRWFGTNTDISEQIKTEEILEKKNQELIKINNDLDNFIYTASHDLKSPVANLEGLLDLIADETEDFITDKGKDILPLIDQSLSRLKMVIKELTEIARIQKDIDVEKEVIQLDEFFKEILHSCENEIKNYKGKILTDFSNASQIIFSRRTLRSLFFNLISNALKYSDPEKEGLVMVKSEKADNYLVLTISDNGLGIPEKQTDKIFTMFKRYHTHVEGSGVGLYIVKRIIENAGGKIEVESQEGKGTTFKLYFPDPM